MIKQERQERRGWREVCRGKEEEKSDDGCAKGSSVGRREGRLQYGRREVREQMGKEYREPYTVLLPATLARRCPPGRMPSERWPHSLLHSLDFAKDVA